MTKLYYTPPSDKCFKELKEKAIEIWRTYSDIGGYSSDKINSIKDIKNISDNFMYIVAMFDQFNQKILAEALSVETREEVRSRMIDGGAYGSSIIF